ncbi:unnamed protein product, partial [Rotaria sp. Silwood2]
FVPVRGSSIGIDPIASWEQNGITIVGGNGWGDLTNQLRFPWGLFIDNDRNSIYVADQFNHRIIKWESGTRNGQVVAGGNGAGSGADQLNHPLDVIVDKQTDSLIIADNENKRIVRWSRCNEDTGITIISNISCVGLTMDENGSLYIVDSNKHEVRRYQRGESQGTIVAGGKGPGNRLDQLCYPYYIFVDGDQSVYVSDHGNHRVMKWMQGATQGVVVAGGQGSGNGLAQLSAPRGVIVDKLGTVYVADRNNNRIMRWPKGACHGSVVVGGNGRGGESNELNHPIGLSFDPQGSLYVADYDNHRVQKFNIAPDT